MKRWRAAPATPSSWTSSGGKTISGGWRSFSAIHGLERIRASITEHIEILDALLSGDQRWASELMRQHLKESQRQTEEHLQHDLEAVRKASSGIELL